ncbi:hypothetical protein [Litorivita sp. NS0012-18]|uniref:hypothetical protein n=1 Tax=Litorivita sp. NS0012-18 TaxID=3127655 RepID=UPI003341E526
MDEMPVYGRVHVLDALPDCRIQTTNDARITHCGNGWHLANNFRTAFIWHMNKHDSSVSKIVRATGISRDVLNKLLARENSSTAVENALRISAYFGKTLEQFMSCDEGGSVGSLSSLVDLLRPDEARLLTAQIQGILRQRGDQSKP